MRPCADVRLILADDLIDDAARIILILKLHRRAEHDAARSRGSDFGSMISALANLRLELVDAALDESLLLARRVIFGVLRQIAVRARLGDGR